MLEEGRCFNDNIGVSQFHKFGSLKAGSSHITKTQSTCIEMNAVPDLLSQNRPEID